MKVIIDANFALYGFPEEREIQVDGPKVTLRTLFQELCKRSAGRLTFINPSTGSENTLIIQKHFTKAMFYGENDENTLARTNGAAGQ
jgi:hypothetical protein